MDGAEAANTNYDSQKFYEVAPNWAMVSWTVLISPLIMSEPKFQSLPADVQDALVQAGQESAAVERAAYAESDAAKLAVLEEKGVTITQPDVTPFREASEAVFAQFITNDVQKRMIELIEEAR